MDGTEDDFLWDDCDDEYKMTCAISNDDKLHDDILTDAQLCQIFEDDRDSEFCSCEKLNGLLYTFLHFYLHMCLTILSILYQRVC